MACKPGSVPRPRADGWPFIWDVRYRTPRATDPDDDAETRLACTVARRPVIPTWSCSWWGLPCRPRCRGRGALLPHPFTLTGRRAGSRTGGLLSVALSLGSPPPDVIRHRISVEPGLSSPRHREAAIQPSDAGGNLGDGGGGCKGAHPQPSSFPRRRESMRPQARRLERAISWSHHGFPPARE